MKEYLFETQSWLGSPVHWNDVATVLIFPLGRVGPNDPTNSYNLLWYAHDPDDIDNRGYNFAFGISHHLIWSFEEWFILDFFQYLMHRLSENYADDLSVV